MALSCGGEMKTFTAIQAGEVMVLEADRAEFHPSGAFLLKDDVLVFAGPSGFTTLIDNDAKVMEGSNES